MPITTYITDAKQKQTHDAEINSVLHLLPKEYLIEESRPYIKTRWFGKDTVKYYYSVYYHIGGIEYQIVSFYVKDSTTTISTMVSADLVMAYIYGLLAGKTA